MKTKDFSMIVFLLGLLVASSCSGSVGNKNQEKVSFNHDQSYTDSCLRHELFETIKEYIRGFYSDSMVHSENADEIVAYYSVYFFEKESDHYFTIWVNTSLPYDYLELQNPSQHFKYAHINVIGSDVILIRLFDYKPEVYNCPETIKEEILNLVKPNEFEIVNDGSWYPITFRYFKDGNDFIINELDTIKVNFLGEDYLRFEEYLKSLENK